MRFLWLGVKSPPQWQMSAWFSLPQQWLMTTWNKQTSTILAQKSAAVLSHCYRSKDKIPRTLKRLYVNCCDFFYAEDFVGRIGIMLNITPLPSPDIFYNRASRSQRGKILWWNKHAGHQADPVSVHCLQTTEKPRDKMHIHLGCSTNPRSCKARSTLNSSVPSDFHLFGFFKDENEQEIFFRFRPDMKKS